MVVEDIMHVRCEEGQMLKENYLKNNSLKVQISLSFLKKNKQHSQITTISAMGSTRAKFLTF